MRALESLFKRCENERKMLGGTWKIFEPNLSMGINTVFLGLGWSQLIVGWHLVKFSTFSTWNLYTRYGLYAQALYEQGVARFGLPYLFI